MKKKICCLLLLCFSACIVFAQNQDTVNVLRRTMTDSATAAAIAADTTRKKDTRNPAFLAKSDSLKNKRDTFFLRKKEYTPRDATLRSLILPGWGQAYNKQYWKIPIVAAGIGIPIGTFIYNYKWYNRSKDAFAVANAIEKDPADTVLVAGLHKAYQQAYYERVNEPTGLADFKNLSTSARNSFRKDMDYSILWTLGMWLLNVADATVFAHLKNFDVSDDLSIKVDPVYFNTTRTPGVRLVLQRK